MLTPREKIPLTEGLEEGRTRDAYRSSNGQNASPWTIESAVTLSLSFQLWAKCVSLDN